MVEGLNGGEQFAKELQEMSKFLKDTESDRNEHLKEFEERKRIYRHVFSGWVGRSVLLDLLQQSRMGRIDRGLMDHILEMADCQIEIVNPKELNNARPDTE